MQQVFIRGVHISLSELGQDIIKIFVQRRRKIGARCNYPPKVHHKKETDCIVSH